MAAQRLLLYESYLVVMVMTVTLSAGHTLCSSLPVTVCSIYIFQGVCPTWTFDDTAFAKLDFIDESDVQVAKGRQVREVIDSTQAMSNTTDKPAADKNSRLSFIAGGAAAAFIVLLIIIVAIIANRRSSSDQRGGTSRATAQRPPEAKTENGERVFQINLAFDHVNADGDRMVVADGNNMYSVPPSNRPAPNR